MNLIHPRSSWHPRHEDGDLTLQGLASGVTLHHTVTKHLSASASPGEEKEQMRVIESVGEGRFGSGISYNVIVFPSGRAYQGASFHRRGTHTGGMNSDVRSICFAGNYELWKPTPRQVDTVQKILARGSGEWWSSSAWLKGHRDVKQTACPGKYVYAHMGEFREAMSGADFVSNPINPLPPARPDGLLVDGFWGRSTTSKLQDVVGTPVDGTVSSQDAAWGQGNPGLTTGWSWVLIPQGSQLIIELQERLSKRGYYKSRVDGLVGPKTFRAMQRDLGTPVDGVVSRQSKMVMALQQRLNKGRF